VLALLGIFYGDVVFKNFLVGTDYLFGVIPAAGSTLANINTAGVLPLMNFAVGIKVIAGLFAIVLVMAHATTKKEVDA
jgi:multicomponent Na+:H+ antiporter subunit B